MWFTLLERLNNIEIENEINLRSQDPPRSRISHDEDECIFRTPRQSISSDRNENIQIEKNDETQERKNQSLGKAECFNHKDEEDNEDEGNENGNNSNSRVSNCGRNIL